MKAIDTSQLNPEKHSKRERNVSLLCYERHSLWVTIRARVQFLVREKAEIQTVTN